MTVDRKGWNPHRIMRARPSPAMVIAMIALFVSLGGTAAALSGSNTVQSDDLGPGAQVKAPDVADNAVNSADVVNNSLTGTDVNALTGADVTNESLTGFDVLNNTLTGADTNESTLGIVPNADQLDGTDSSGFLASGSVQELNFEDAASNTDTDLATVGPYTIGAKCGIGVSSQTFVMLYANGPAGTSDLMSHLATDDAGHSHLSSRTSLAASTNNSVASALAPDGDKVRTAGTAMLKTGSDVVQVDFNGVADNPSGSGGENCYLYGTAMTGT